MNLKNINYTFQKLKNFQFFTKPQRSDQNQNKLPENFAEDLLFNELQLESPNLKIETISRLLELYGQAVEFFSSQRDDRYLIFKNKTQSLLLRRNVTEVLNGLEKEKEKSIITNTSSNALVKKKEMQNQLSQSDGTEEVQRFLHNERNINLKTQSIIDNDLIVQESRIAQRMIKRVKDPQILMKKSSSMNSLQKIEISRLIIPSQSTKNLDSIEQVNSPMKSLQILEEQNEENSPNMRAEGGIQKQNMTDQNLQKTPTKQQVFQFDENFVNQKSKKEISEPLINIKPVSQEVIIASKEKRIREMVSKNKELQRQKTQLMKKNSILPF